MIAFLPPISQTTFLTKWLLVGRDARGLDDVQADSFGAGEGDDRDARIAHAGRADGFALAGQELQHIARHARLPEDFAEHAGDARRLLGGFDDRVLPVTSAATVMPQQIASGKFHGLMTTATPPRLVPLLVRLADEIGPGCCGVEQPWRPRGRRTRRSRWLRRRRRRLRPRSCRTPGRRSRASSSRRHAK